mmetsp:Transcript_47240/g.151389  ORF Transcript_47240/g.151389 Transcript_47240/m.151389 type:complete len:92 (-) Transcript_47240:28-303(-)
MGGGAGPLPDGASAEERATKLASDICGFITAAGGRAPSGEIVRKFQEGVGRQNMALFKQVLKQVAELKEERGGKLWFLRPEFAPGGGGASG